MSHFRQVALPASEPVDLAAAKQFCRILQSFSDDDSMLTGFIQAAREHAEIQTGRCLAQRQFELVLDSHPYYTDTIQSQQAYPPSYYSLPRYSTTLWNYSQMIKLPWPPLKSVDSMRYVASDGTTKTLLADIDFVVDRISEPARIFPIPGQYWPADLYTPNAVLVNFTAGHDPSPTKAADVRTAGAQITNVQIAANLLTLTAKNDFAVGQSVVLNGLATATFLNGQTVVITSATATQFQATFTHADYPSAADTGGALPPLSVGQQPDSTVLLAVPQTVRTVILMLVNHWYVNREPVAAGQVGTVPQHLNELLWGNAVVDFSPTRG